MEFQLTKEWKVNLPEHQEGYISRPDRLRQGLCQNDVFTYDMLVGDQLIGNVMVRQFAPHSFFLWNYAINPKFQGQGYGKRGLRLLIDFLSCDQDMHRMTTTVTKDNLVAYQMYLDLGFQVTDVVESDNVAEINMVLLI